MRLLTGLKTRLVIRTSLREVCCFILPIGITELSKLIYPIKKGMCNKYLKNDQKLSISLYFKSLEKMHSTNSNENEKSIVQKQSHESKLTKIKSLCKLPIDKNIELDKINKISDIILVTWIISDEDLDLITNVLNIHFSFIIGCFFSKKINITNINEYINKKTTGGITLIDAKNFQNCAYYSVNIGLKQNTFIFAKRIKNFSFWSNNIKLKETNERINIIELENNPKVNINFIIDFNNSHEFA